jgi:ubiquinone/menaquinone biosynthesis C-methylase UbiE
VEGVFGLTNLRRRANLRLAVARPDQSREKTVTFVSRCIEFASQRFPRLSSRVLASSGYTTDLASFGDNAFGVWSRATAERQDRAWQPIVAAAKAGHPREDVAALYDAIGAISAQTTSLLEVGCGGGYNSEVIASRFPKVNYRGIDISSSMIDIAREHYPNREFSVGSAYELACDNKSFDAVVDGVALLHMQEWKRAIAEYARVARSHVILHGLTLTDTSATSTFGKYAYGQPSLELVFNRGEMLAECAAVGLTLQEVYPGLDYDLKNYIGIQSTSESWLLGL